jgi:hypothetical protein
MCIYPNKRIWRIFTKAQHTKAYLFALVIITFSSCVTLQNKPTTKISVYSDNNTGQICINNDTTQWYNLPVKLDVERSKDDLLIRLKNDSITKDYAIESKSSASFCFDNIATFGIGYFIVRNSPKRYTYPSKIFLDSNGVKPY